MAVRRIIKMGHPTLRKVANPIPNDEIRSAQVRLLVRDMVETLADYGGIGLAAPQINESVRLAILNIPEERHSADNSETPIPLTICVNPRFEILDQTAAGYWEGCLSVPGLRGFVERPQFLRLRYTDLDAIEHSIELRGFPATVVQHELDHLDGVLYVDRLADKSKLMFEEEFQKFVAPPEYVD